MILNRLDSHRCLAIRSRYTITNGWSVIYVQQLIICVLKEFTHFNRKKVAKSELHWCIPSKILAFSLCIWLNIVMDNGTNVKYSSYCLQMTTNFGINMGENKFCMTNATPIAHNTQRDAVNGTKQSLGFIININHAEKRQRRNGFFLLS
jgi:hypothetical protein